MTAALRLVMRDRDLAEDLVRTGLYAIRTRHTCAHRAAELMAIIEGLRAQPVVRSAPAGLEMAP
jgi:hypothetical protein